MPAQPSGDIKPEGRIVALVKGFLLSVVALVSSFLMVMLGSSFIFSGSAGLVISAGFVAFVTIWAVGGYLSGRWLRRPIGWVGLASLPLAVAVYYYGEPLAVAAVVGIVILPSLVGYALGVRSARKAERYVGQVERPRREASKAGGDCQAVDGRGRHCTLRSGHAGPHEGMWYTWEPGGQEPPPPPRA